MPGDTDLTKLTKKQLISMVQVLTQAVQFGATADDVLFEKIDKGNIKPGDFEKFMTAKADIVTSLMKAQEIILSEGEKATVN